MPSLFKPCTRNSDSLRPSEAEALRCLSHMGEEEINWKARWACQFECLPTCPVAALYPHLDGLPNKSCSAFLPWPLGKRASFACFCLCYTLSLRLGRSKMFSCASHSLLNIEMHMLLCQEVVSLARAVCALSSALLHLTWNHEPVYRRDSDNWPTLQVG